MNSSHTHKRNKSDRAHKKGYLAAIRGRSIDQCPYTGNADLRGNWLGGWREGRPEYLQGYISDTVH